MNVNNQRGISPENPSAGVIRPDELYTLEAFKRRINFKDAALRQARRLGLKVYRKQGRTFLLGKDWIEYVTGKAAASEPQVTGTGT